MGAVRKIVPRGVDGLFDTALRLDAAMDAIRDGGAMATVRGWEPDHPVRGIRVSPVWVVKVLERTDYLHKLRALVSDGVIVPRIAATITPADVADAHRMIDAGGLRGRIVITF